MTTLRLPMAPEREQALAALRLRLQDLAFARLGIVWTDDPDELPLRRVQILALAETVAKRLLEGREPARIGLGDVFPPAPVAYVEDDPRLEPWRGPGRLAECLYRAGVRA